MVDIVHYVLGFQVVQRQEYISVVVVLDKGLAILVKIMKFPPANFNVCALLSTRICNEHKDKLYIFYVMHF